MELPFKARARKVSWYTTCNTVTCKLSVKTLSHPTLVQDLPGLPQPEVLHEGGCAEVQDVLPGKASSMSMRWDLSSLSLFAKAHKFKRDNMYMLNICTYTCLTITYVQTYMNTSDLMYIYICMLCEGAVPCIFQ